MKPFNLFAYGTLMNPATFRAVLGRTLVPGEQDAGADLADSFPARNAVLDGYTKVSPDSTYLYAVQDPHGRIRGYLIGPLPGECMSALRKFEGRNYRRKRVRVHTREGVENAVAFLGNIEQMGHSFGYQFHDPLKQEILLERKIDAAVSETGLERLRTDDDSSHRAVRELHGSTIRDIVRRHFDAGGISDYAIRHSIKDSPLRDYARIEQDKTAQALAPYYLAMVLRQVIFNEVERRIRQEFRYELDSLDPRQQHYELTISSLAALRFLNANDRVLSFLVGDCLRELKFARNRLVDFVRWAVRAADSVYETGRARAQIAYVRNHVGAGAVPLGAELEFSNIGQLVIRDSEAKTLQDIMYDSFYYFYDFGLDALTWKLGGHIDDHRKKAVSEPRRGFFELALGSLSIQANISKPVTSDPWVLNQLIHEARRFYRVKPHSVHISLQLRSRHKPVRDRLLPLSMMKCLFAIAGDAAYDQTGRLRVNRLVTDEIITTDPAPGMMFSQISRRHSVSSDDSEAMGWDRDPGRFVQQFKFLRLSPDINYEPVVLALKGLQLKLSPGSFMTPSNYRSRPSHRRLFEQLVEWGQGPGPIQRVEAEEFLEAVREGLLSERRGQPAHGEAYIAWAVAQLQTMLDKFNALARDQRPARPATPIGSM